MHEFCQWLNLCMTYEGNSKAKYVKAHSQSSKSSSSPTTSIQSNRASTPDAQNSNQSRLTKPLGVSLLYIHLLGFPSYRQLAVLCTESKTARLLHTKKVAMKSIVGNQMSGPCPISTLTKASTHTSSPLTLKRGTPKHC
jgi:hypothetical protein